MPKTSKPQSTEQLLVHLLAEQNKLLAALIAVLGAKNTEDKMEEEHLPIDFFECCKTVVPQRRDVSSASLLPFGAGDIAETLFHYEAETSESQGEDPDEIPGLILRVVGKLQDSRFFFAKYDAPGDGLPPTGSSRVADSLKELSSGISRQDQELLQQRGGYMNFRTAIFGKKKAAGR